MPVSRKIASYPLPLLFTIRSVRIKRKRTDERCAAGPTAGRETDPSSQNKMGLEGEGPNE